jgi:hypothetical protein
MADALDNFFGDIDAIVAGIAATTASAVPTPKVCCGLI